MKLPTLNQSEQDLVDWLSTKFPRSMGSKDLMQLYCFVRNVRKSGMIEATKELQFCHPRGIAMQMGCEQCFLSGVNEMRIYQAVEKL